MFYFHQRQHQLTLSPNTNIDELYLYLKSFDYPKSILSVPIPKITASVLRWFRTVSLSKLKDFYLHLEAVII